MWRKVFVFNLKLFNPPNIYILYMYMWFITARKKHYFTLDGQSYQWVAVNVWFKDDHTGPLYRKIEVL